VAYDIQLAAAARLERAVVGDCAAEVDRGGAAVDVERVAGVDRHRAAAADGCAVI